MRRHDSRPMLIAAATAALTVALAGCGASGQSKAAACEIVNDGTAELTGTANELMSTATSGDTAEVANQIATFDTALKEIGTQITNSEVKPVFDDFAAAFSTLNGQIQALSDVDPADSAAVETALADMEGSTAALQQAQTAFTDTCTT